jgi:hypothetical protein
VGGRALAIRFMAQRDFACRSDAVIVNYDQIARKRIYSQTGKQFKTDNIAMDIENDRLCGQRARVFKRFVRLMAERSVYITNESSGGYQI